MLDLTFDRRKFLSGLFAAPIVTIVEPKITYFIPPVTGWQSYADLLASVNKRFTFVAFMAINKELSMEIAARDLEKGILLPTVQEIRKYQKLIR